MSTDRRLPVTDYHGQTPCIEPHILGRLLDRLPPVRASISYKPLESDPWECIDRLSEAMEAARP